jgi:outer membrane scaffolding protein for murein synthesis (MipA/OmpV family)
MFRAGRLVVIPGAGIRYWSGELASYEYGLQPGEAGFPAGHELGGAVIPEASLSGSWTLGAKWSIVGFARASRLGDGIVASPIVGNRTETMLGIGLARRVW